MFQCLRAKRKEKKDSESPSFLSFSMLDRCGIAGGAVKTLRTVLRRNKNSK